jgi:mannose-6-phosphate isomerase-like protein (cupin superfamily)
MITSDEAYRALSHTLLYEQKLVYAIDFEHRQIPLSNFGELVKHRVAGCSIKVEGMERFSSDIFSKGLHYAIAHKHSGPVTCHMFISPAGSPSFPMHIDPDDVIIHGCEGVKHMVVDNQSFDITPNSFLYIPYNTPHMALNHCDAITLSFGLERYLKDKINELGVLS